MAVYSESTEKQYTINQKYVVQKKIGSGEYSEVYKALQLSTQQIVAIKIIKLLEQDDQDTIKNKKARFQREMKLCGELNHPGIVEILDSGVTESDLLYTVFEFIPGKTLAEILTNENPLTIGRTVNIIIQLFDALSAVHKNEIIHRDLKPANIMITNTGSIEQVKIIDFGIGTFTPTVNNTQTVLTQTNTFLGTPAYASPEQLRGEKVTEKTDIYSMGLIFLECLTGNHPLKNESTVQLIQKQLSSDSIPLPQSILSHPFGILLKRMLEKESTRRASNIDRIVSQLKKANYAVLCKNSPYLLEPQSQSLLFDNNELAEAQSTEGMRRKKFGTVAHFTFSINQENTLDLNTDTIDDIYIKTLEHCAIIIKNAGGHIDSISSNGVISVIFGYPQNRDTDQRLAAQCALQISTFLKRQNLINSNKHKFTISIKCCIYSGTIGIRDTNTSIQLFGEPFRYASAICNTLNDNEIVLNEKCHTVVKKNYQCTKISENDTIQFQDNMPLFFLKGEKTFEGFKKNSDDESPFIGRVEELTILNKNFDRIKKRKTRAVLVSGEAGIGKSSLLARFIKNIQEQQSDWIEFHFAPESQNSALYPFLNYIKKKWEIGDDNNKLQGETIIYEQMKNYNKSIKIETAVPLFCWWLGEKCVKYPPLQQSPVKQKEILIDLLIEIILHTMTQSSPIIFCEDLHWADSLSIDLISKLLTELQNNKLLAILTSRPEFNSPWEKNQCKVLPMEPLPTNDVASIISNHKDLEISQILKDTIIERADGNPLFIEELLNMLTLYNGSETYLNSFDKIPHTLNGILNSRFEKVGEAKETAILGSVMGRHFTYSLIAQISTRNEAELLADLDELVSLDILTVVYQSDEFEYSFKHALIRDCVYENISEDNKVKYHELVASLIEKKYPEKLSTQPELLFNHWTKAKQYDKATEFGIKATQLALGRTLNDDAIQFANSSIVMCQKYTNDKNKELTLNNLLMQTLMFKHGWGDPKTTKVIKQAMALIDKVDNPKLQIQALGNKTLMDGVAGNRVKAKENAQKLLKLAQQTTNDEYITATKALVGFNSWIDGDYDTSKELLESAIEIKLENLLSPNACLFGFHSKIWAMATLADIYWFLYEEDEKALQLIDNAIELAQKLNHIPSLGVALWHKAIIYQYMGNKEQVQRYANQVLALSSQYGLQQYECYMRIFLSWVNSNPEAGKQSLQIIEMIGSRNTLTYYKSILADIEYDLKNYEAAININREALSLCDEMEEYYFQPELLRKQAQYLHAMELPQNIGLIKECLQRSI